MPPQPPLHGAKGAIKVGAKVSLESDKKSPVLLSVT